MGQATIKFPTKEYEEIRHIQEKLSYISARSLLMDAVRAMALDLGGVNRPTTEDETLEMFGDVQKKVDEASLSLDIVKTDVIRHLRIARRIIRNRRRDATYPRRKGSR